MVVVDETLRLLHRLQSFTHLWRHQTTGGTRQWTVLMVMVVVVGMVVVMAVISKDQYNRTREIRPLQFHLPRGFDLWSCTLARDGDDGGGGMSDDGDYSQSRPCPFTAALPSSWAAAPRADADNDGCG